MTKNFNLGPATEIIADSDLQNVKQYANQVQRFGFFKVHFKNLTIYCCDLLSFYMATKDIFIHEIYKFNSQVRNPRVIDGGGHIGLFTLYAKKLYPESQITVFEPDALSLYLLRLNIEANNLGSVQIVEAGLHDRDGSISFASDGSDGSSLCSNDQEPSTTTIAITKLSPFLNQRVDFLKLNIEGSELEVVQESEKLLTAVNELVIEYHGFSSLGQRLHKILNILDGQGFRYMIHDFDAETNNASKPPFNIEQDSRFFLLIYAKRLFAQKNLEVDSSAELTRVEPICRKFGFTRGKPIDRYYIENFIKANSKNIKGRVLEIGDDSYTKEFGKEVIKSDVLNTTAAPGTTIVSDLSVEGALPEQSFDCIILTQTLQFLYEYKVALKNLISSLKPGGKLLLTASGISQISRFDMDRWGEFWRFTDLSLKSLLKEISVDCYVDVQAHGNLATAKAFLDGRAQSEISAEVMNFNDPDYQLVITACVTKAARINLNDSYSSEIGLGKNISQRTVPELETPKILLYHRVFKDPVDSQLLSVSPENFAQQVEYLARNYRVLGLEELVDELNAGIFNKNTIALTFDDGYFDNYQYALPILEHYKVPATFFISSGYIGTNKEFYWDALERLILLENAPIPQLVLTTNQDNLILPLETKAEKFQTYEKLCEIVKILDPDSRDLFLNQLYDLYKVPNQARSTHRPMTWEEVKALYASPVAEVGVHTVNHSCLSRLNFDQQFSEISNCKKDLEKNLSTEINLCSYPWGTSSDYTENTIGILKQLKFKAGIANIQSSCKQPYDAFQVPRRLVRNWDQKTFAKWLVDDQANNLEKNELDLRIKRLQGEIYEAAKNSAY